MSEGLRRRLNLLGGLAFHAEAAPETTIRISTRKGCALLAYLAMQPAQRASREHLATLLWGDRNEQQARQCLRQCLARTRSDLTAASADILHVEADAVALRMQALSVDALEFTRLGTSDQDADLECAIALYRGEFLAGFHVEAEAFDNWMGMERERLTMLAGHAFATLAARADAAGRGHEAIAAAERLIALDPLREDWHRLTIRLHARHRGGDAALARAKGLAGLLKKELGVDHDPETARLIETIRSGAIAPVAATNGQTAHDVGRAQMRPMSHAEAADGRATARGWAVVQRLGQRPAAAVVLSVVLAAVVSGSIVWLFGSSRRNVAVVREQQLDGVPVPTGTTFEYQRYAPAGQEILIGSHSAADKDCVHDGFPLIVVLSPPAHGTITTRERPVIMGGQRRFHPTHCRSVSNLGVGVHYQPADGFVGIDRVSYRVQYVTPPITHYDMVMDITVFPVSR